MNCIWVTETSYSQCDVMSLEQIIPVMCLMLNKSFFVYFSNIIHLLQN